MAEYDSVIPAGGSGKVVAKVATRSTYNGRLRKSVIVTTNAPVAKTIPLKIEAEMVPAVQIRPTPYLRLETLEGERASGHVVLHRTDGKPLEVLGTRIGDDTLFGVNVTPVDGEDNIGGPELGAGDVRVEVIAKPQKGYVSKGDRLEIQINHPEVPVLTIPVSLRVRPVIQATPGHVRFRLTPAQKDRGASSVVVLRHNQGKEFSVTSVKSSAPDLVVAEPAEETSPEGRPMVRVTVPAAAWDSLGKGSRMAELIVETDAPEHAEIRIPVSLARTVMTRQSSPEPVHRKPALRKQPRRLRRVPVKRVPATAPTPTPTSGTGEPNDGRPTVVR